MNFRLFFFFFQNLYSSFHRTKLLFLHSRIFRRSKKHHFFDEVLQGVIRGPPLKNTILARSRAPGPCVRRISEKGGETPHPADGPAGGFGHFFYRFRRQGGVGARDLPAKLAKTGGTPFLSTFWPFWDKVAQTGEFLGALGVQVIEEKRNLPSRGVSSEATIDTVRTK